MLELICGMVIGFVLRQVWCDFRPFCPCKQDDSFHEIKNKLKKIKKGKK